MSVSGKCSFHRRPENTGMGWCEIDSRTKCAGDIQFCKKTEALRRYLLEKRKGKGNLDERKGLASFF